MDIAYDYLRAKLITGDFAQGVRLNEARLAREIGVSRGPIREAIRVLTREGLLTFASHLGCFVVRLTPAHMAEVLEVRSSLEPAAYAKVFARRGAAFLGPLFAAVREMRAAESLGDVSAVVAAHSRLHGSIYEAAGPVFAHQWLNLDPLLQMYMNTHTTMSDLSGIVREHEALLESLAEGDGEAALKMHLERHRFSRSWPTGESAAS